MYEKPCQINFLLKMKVLDFRNELLEKLGSIHKGSSAKRVCLYPPSINYASIYQIQ